MRESLIEAVVNHPSHYTCGKYEVIDVIEDKLTSDEFEGYLIGNVLKYVMRYRHKGGTEDLMKARWYLDKLVSVRDRRKYLRKARWYLDKLVSVRDKIVSVCDRRGDAK